MTLPLIATDSQLAEYQDIIYDRYHRAVRKAVELCGSESNLAEFANGHLFYGLTFDGRNWNLREFAPNATAVFMVGDFNGWREDPDYELVRINARGDWQRTFPMATFRDGQRYKLLVRWPGGQGLRLPTYTRHAAQDPDTKMFAAEVYAPDRKYFWQHPAAPRPAYPLIYEAHVGMATEEERVGTFREFADDRLDDIAAAGYNTLQLMAVQEHPYYGSFGYHVSNLFAVSSRFGHPHDLKYLVDQAHARGLCVVMDLVHSHSAKNTDEGLGELDGDRGLYFHTDSRRLHPAWDSLCYDYGKNHVLHLLLSNCKYWLEEYNLDGFRFDGVTSMLYRGHGLGVDFTNYAMYYDGTQDEDAITYLTLANLLIHQVRPQAVTIAEEMSGMPGLAAPHADGGIGFDYRMAMGVPDYWIRTVKERPDEEWPVGDIYHNLTLRRPEERVISYAESHDQALVGDQTLIFRLIKEQMYTRMAVSTQSIEVDRGVALHKLIRLATFGCSGGGYLNFMGNEWGHPEWIDFPRAGNQWSYKYARRQWSLRDNPFLRYRHLAAFDTDMLATIAPLLPAGDPVKTFEDSKMQILAFARGPMLFIFNFNPLLTAQDYDVDAPPGRYALMLSTDDERYGGFGNIRPGQEYFTHPVVGQGGAVIRNAARVMLPPRTAIVLKINS